MFCFDIENNFGTQHALQMLQASEKDLPVPVSFTGQLSTIVVISESFDFLNRIRMSDEVSLSGFPE